MPISRLRLQLAGTFALVFLVGLGAADFALFSYLRRNAELEFRTKLTATAAGVAGNIAQEIVATHGTMLTAAAEVLGEWPKQSDGLLVYDSAGNRLAARGPAALLRLVPAAAQLPAGDHTWQVPLDDEGALALALARSADFAGLSVVAFSSTAGLDEANEHLALLLSLSVPLVVLLALIGAYFLAHLSLAPLHAMTRQIAAIAPQDLDRRLPVRRPADELDTLAHHFNQLLERLSLAQARNRRFVAHAAHQLRTPLTVIRGESSLGLDKPRSADDHRDLLRRVSLAAEQMTHRVNDLLLLAQAEAGDRPPLVDRVELDGLVLECVDLMRGRAAALGRQLELGTMDAAEIVGNEALIREAVTELIENACRYGDAARPIRIATLEQGSGGRIEVASGGAPIAMAAVTEDASLTSERAGLGLSIIRWIASAHGGLLALVHEDGVNTFRLDLAAGPHPHTEARSP